MFSSYVNTQENFDLGNIYRINFIHKAISIIDNPAHDSIVAEVKQAIIYFPANIDHVSEQIKKEFIVDKMELIFLMKSYELEKYKMIKRQATDRLKKIILYSEKHTKILNRLF